MKERNYTPLIMLACLLTGIIVITLTRSSRIIDLWNRYPVNVDLVFVGLYILWMLTESRSSIKDVRTENKRISDSATCQIYGFGQAITFLTALWFQPIWHSPNIFHLLGIGIFLFGVCYRLWAVNTLGQFYSHLVQVTSAHRIVDSGPYRFTRHPAYAGMIVANAGVALYFFNWVTICTFVFVLVPAILLRIFIEEKTLFGIDGYAQFAEKRKRLFPPVW